MNMEVIKFSRILILLTLSGFLFACKDDNAQVWKIGKDQPMSKTLVELESPKNIKLCSDEYKHISFPLVLHIDYDENRYYGLLEGLCITVHAKTLKIKFANPSSGKMARGTYEILE